MGQAIEWRRPQNTIVLLQCSCGQCVYLAVVALGPGFKLRWGRRVKKSKKTENLEGTLRDQNGKRMVGNILTRPPLVSCLVF